MTDYHVTWSIEISADSKREAAQKALEIQRDPTSTATVFHVYGPDNATQPNLIDLLEEGETNG